MQWQVTGRQGMLSAQGPGLRPGPLTLLADSQTCTLTEPLEALLHQLGEG